MRYSRPQILYHWLSAGLIVIMVGTGMAYSYDLADDGAMMVHQIAGQSLIVVLVIRLITRFLRPPHPVETAHHKVEKILSQLVHLGLYLVMIAFVVTGYISASAETDSALIAPVSLAFARSDMGEMILEVHFLLKWALLALVALHIAGALKHHFWDKDATLSQMTFSAKRG